MGRQGQDRQDRQDRIALMKRLVFASLGAVVLALAIVSPQAQMRVAPLDMPQGHVALGLALRHLANVSDVPCLLVA